MPLLSFARGFGIYIVLSGVILVNARFSNLTCGELVSYLLVLMGLTTISYTYFSGEGQSISTIYMLVSGSVLLICGAVCLSLLQIIVSSLLNNQNSFADTETGGQSGESNEVTSIFTINPVEHNDGSGKVFWG